MATDPNDQLGCGVKQVTAVLQSVQIRRKKMASRSESDFYLQLAFKTEDGLMIYHYISDHPNVIHNPFTRYLFVKGRRKILDVIDILALVNDKFEGKTFQLHVKEDKLKFSVNDVRTRWIITKGQMLGNKKP